MNGLLALGVVLVGAVLAASSAVWETREGDLVTALHTGWSDMLLHIRAAIFFATQGGWPNESFLLSGEPVGYAFAVDWISALLWKSGFSLAAAFALPTIVFTLISLAAIHGFVWRWTRSWTAGVIAVVLFLGFGSAAGVLLAAPQLGAESVPVLEALRTLPHDITVWHEGKLELLNPIIMMLHQRAFLLGFPTLMLVLASTAHWLQTGSRGAMVVAALGGILSASLHPHTWLAAILLIPSWFLVARLLRVRTFHYRDFLWGAAALGVVIGGGMVVIRSLQPNVGTALLRWQPGWLAGDDGWALFWLKNLGVYVPLWGLALRYLLRANPLLASLHIASLVPFLAANMVAFSPWEWDNTKVFATVWLVLVVSTGTLLQSWWRRGVWQRLGVVVVILLLSASGGLEFLRVYAFSRDPLVLATTTQQAFGGAIRTVLPERAVVLTAPVHNHPAFVLSGRPAFVAYEGWLWSHGWRGRYEDRMEAVRRIYGAAPDAEALLAEYRISFTVFGPAEAALGSSPHWWSQRFPVVLSMDPYTVYDTRALWQRVEPTI